MGSLLLMGAWKGDIKIISCAPGGVQSNSRMPQEPGFPLFGRGWGVDGNYVASGKNLSLMPFS